MSRLPVSRLSLILRAPWLVLAVLVVWALACAGAAQAMSIRELRALAKSDSKQGENWVLYYQVGLMEGVMEAHDRAVREGAKPTVCLNGRSLTPAMAKSLFNTELQRNADTYEADMPAQLVMSNALGTVYPCTD